MSNQGLRGAGNNPAASPYTRGPYTWDQLINLNKPGVEGSGRYVLTENFNQLPQLNAVVNAAFTDADATAAANTAIKVASNLASRDFEVLGTNATSAQVTHGTTIGAIALATAGADNDQTYICPHLDTNQTAWTDTLWGTENQVIWECVIKTNSAILTTLIWAGLKLTYDPTVATDDDQAYFRFSTDDSDTNWEVVNSIGGTDVTSDSGVAVAASTIYYFRIEIDADRRAHYFIDGKEVYCSTAMTNDIDLIPYIGIQALTGAARTMWVSKQKISRIVYE